LKVILNSPCRVTSLPLGSPLEGLPYCSLRTGSISSADNGTFTPLEALWSPEPRAVGQVAPRAGGDEIWVGEVAECTSLPLANQQEYYLQQIHNKASK
jgi:hypothetical protein